MPEYIIENVHADTRDWLSKFAKDKGQTDPDMRSYRLDLKDGDGNVRQRIELAQKITTAAPQAGSKIEGTINERQYGDPPKTDYKLTKPAGGGGGGRGGGGRAWKPRPDDAPPVWSGKQAQIVAQHSQNMALRVLELAARTEPTTTVTNPGEVVEGLDPVAAIMDRLGVKTTVQKERCPGCGQLTEAEADGAEVDTIDLGLVDAFSLHANEAFERAWAREERNSTISDAMKESA